jgi:hypothetical protein
VTETRLCVRCGQMKPRSDFSPRDPEASRNKDGLHCWGKPCVAAYFRQRRARHGDCLRKCGPKEAGG